MIYPPTPTPLPPGATPVFNIPEQYSLWASSEYAIQSWNLMDSAAKTTIQFLILAVIIGAGLYILNRFTTDFTEEDSKE